MVRAVLFDLDDTLHDRAASLRAFVADQHVRLFDRLCPLDAFVREFMALDAHGQLSKRLLYPRLLKRLGIDRVDAGLLSDDYGSGFHAHVRSMSGRAKLLQQLRLHDFKLGLVTNGWTDFQERTIDAIGMRQAFDVIMISEREALRKPDPRLFERAAAMLGVRPSQCVFVGDNPNADVVGASDAGMIPIWFRRGFASRRSARLSLPAIWVRRAGVRATARLR